MPKIEKIMEALGKCREEFEERAAHPKPPADRPKRAQRDFSPYVHEFVDGEGHTRYAVGEWDAEHRQYWRPHDQHEYTLTGCSTFVAKSLEEMQNYPTRAQALRRARYLWGKIDSWN